MAFERKLAVVPPQAFTADGTEFGVVTVADSCKFRVKESAYLVNTAGQTLAVQVKKVINPTQLIVGKIDNKISNWPLLDISAWTVASGAAIGAEEQNKNNIPPDDHYVAIYEADPVVADRVITVDCNGNFYGPENPFPVSVEGSISIGQVEVIGSNGNIIEPNPDGSINVVIENSPAQNEQNISITYNESAPVASGSPTTILTYTIPALSTASLQRIFVSGENIARFDILVNSVPIATKRTYFGGALDADFSFNSSNGEGVLLSSGSIVSIQVLHNRPNTAIFEATLEIILNPTAISGQTVIVTYNEINSVVNNVTTSIVSYTVPLGKTATLQRVLAAGENTARYDVFVNSTVIGTKRTYFGGALNTSFEFSGVASGGVLLNAGDMIIVKTIHFRPSLSSFESTIEVIEF